MPTIIGYLITLLVLGLTETEVIAQAFVVFLGGFESTRTSIAMLLYCLANNLECQQKLIEEIDSILEDKVNSPLYLARGQGNLPPP